MEGKLIGEVFNYVHKLKPHPLGCGKTQKLFDFERVGVAALNITDSLKVGDSIRIVGGDKDFTEIIDSMQINGKNVEKAKKGDNVGIKISEKVHKGYRVYKV